MTPISASDLCNQIGWFKEFPKNQGQDIKCTRRAMNLFLHCTYIKQYTDVKVFLKYRQNSLKRETQKNLFTLENARKFGQKLFSHKLTGHAKLTRAKHARDQIKNHQTERNVP